MRAKLRIFSDGASRGNPGPAAIAFLVVGEGREIVKRYSEYLGVRTNNQAEYEALIQALEFVAKMTREEVVCHMDSELVVKQLNQIYKVRDSKLKPLWLKANGLAQQFRKIVFVHVPRTDIYIQEVDYLANQTLDGFSGPKR